MGDFMDVGKVAVFLGSCDHLEGFESVFARGDLVVVESVEGDGELMCRAVTIDGRASGDRRGMLWPEELLVVNNAPLLAPEGRVR